mgnify:CR=1 FL=1
MVEVREDSQSPPDPAGIELPSEEAIARYLDLQEVNIRDLLPSQKETSFKLEEKQEATRSQLATFLLKMLAGTLTASLVLIVALTLVSVFVPREREEAFEQTSNLAKDLITLILTTQTGLVGTALGFYFGSRGNNFD